MDGWMDEMDVKLVMLRINGSKLPYKKLTDKGQEST